jgi:hypothetical protein
MWDFELGRAFGAMARTAPFIVFRMLVYFGIGILYVFATGIGGAIGYGVTSFGDAKGAGAPIGALIGFVAAAGIVYWLREYILYLVKAGHIAVLVKYMDNEPLPGGRGQIDYAKEVVTQRFKESSILFALDQLLKGVIRAIFGIVATISNLLPIPGLNQLVAMARSVVRMSLTYVDEIMLAHIIRANAANPWEQGRQSLVLYAQNFAAIAKNAVWLAMLMWVLTFAVFALIVGPVVALIALFPGELGAMSFVAAFMLAWAFKAALLEPLAIYALMTVYFKEIEGQVPNPEWDGRLASASAKFRQLKDKAAAAVETGPARTSTITT